LGGYLITKEISIAIGIFEIIKKRGGSLNENKY